MTTDGFVSELRTRTWAVLPVPRKLELKPGHEWMGSGMDWGLKLENVDENDIAVRTLLEGLKRDRYIELETGVRKLNYLELRLQPGAIDTGTEDGRDEQAYRIECEEGRIRLTGNACPGLFHGVQTLLQLVASRGPVPHGTITDWPEYELRCIHWDTKHHQDRPETLKRFIDQAARFKINAVLFELEDKFEYPSHPIIGAPGAFTTEELQELVDYALERHIQIIPDVQSPAHLCYVLKHDEFAHLRCDGSNYQACMDKPEVRELLFDMYDDVCRATQGVDYFHVSTDEVYYAGICETARAPYNPENRSLTWVDYVNAAHEHITEKWGRKVIVWAEFPLLAEHVKLLPNDLLNGVGGRKEPQTTCENERGIRQFCYVSMQGGEAMFPNYFTCTGSDGRPQRGRIESAVDEIARGRDKMPNALGMISAAWDDSGLHNETFWLGWAMTTQAAWTPGTAMEEAVASFFDLFYGRDAEGMGELYHDLQLGARFVSQSLDRLPSKVRGPGYGYHDRKTPVQRGDRTLVPPPLPEPDDLAFEPAFRERYAAALAAAPAERMRSDLLLLRLQANLARTERNRYNLEAFLSIARLQRRFIDTLLELAEAEDRLADASEAADAGEHDRAVNLLVDARDVVRTTVDRLYATYERVKTTWEKSRFEKGRSVDGREFVHVMDDVKDHTADRRPDLSYLIEWFELMDLGAWLDELGGRIREYAGAHDIPVAASEEPALDE
ncbi:MAG: family 20 glycosylhydrolase [Planctomycetota bacterium]